MEKIIKWFFSKWYCPKCDQTQNTYNGGVCIHCDHDPVVKA